MLKLCDSTHNSSTIHSAIQSSHCTLRRTLMQTHTHPSAAIYAPPVHTHTHTPLHTLTHTAVTPTHAHPCSNIRTTCAHHYTYKYLQISSLQLSQCLFTNIYKYPPMHTFTNICKYPHSHTTVPII